MDMTSKEKRTLTATGFDRLAMGTRLRAAREEKRLTQRELAIAADMTERTISNIENGVTMPTVEVIHRLCFELDVELCYILQGRTSRGNDRVTFTIEMGGYMPDEQRRRILELSRMLTETMVGYKACDVQA